MPPTARHRLAIIGANVAVQGAGLVGQDQVRHDGTPLVPKLPLFCMQSKAGLWVGLDVSVGKVRGKPMRILAVMSVLLVIAGLVLLLFAEQLFGIMPS